MERGTDGTDLLRGHRARAGIHECPPHDHGGRHHGFLWHLRRLQPAAHGRDLHSGGDPVPRADRARAARALDRERPPERSGRLAPDRLPRGGQALHGSDVRRRHDPRPLAGRLGQAVALATRDWGGHPLGRGREPGRRGRPGRNRRRPRRRSHERGGSGMTRDPSHDLLFEPVQIGPKTMRNRFYKTAHCSSFGVDWPGTQAHFRAMAAEGGWACVSTEYCSIHPSSDAHPSFGARLWDETDVANLSLMCDKIHEHGSLAGVQLWYGAAHARNYESRMPARGVSQIPSDYLFMQSCYEVDRREIRELQEWHVAAARRARSAGFDVINVYGGHGYPITYQFLDPYYNKRTDEYGGSFENRARFWLETIELVKEAVGDDCAVIARHALDSLREGGLTAEESLSFMELSDHLIDLWDLQVGGVIGEWGEVSLASRFGGENFQRPWLERARPHTAKPIVGVGRFTNPDTMVEMVQSGVIDVIGGARPSLADPFLPRKIEEGRLDDIRECIGCNICAGRYMQRSL